MTASTAPAGRTTGRSPAVRAGWIALWALQILLGLFFVVGSGAPKFVGETYAVQIFAEIGVGQWLRFVVGAIEVIGGVGLLVPRLAGAAATGLVALMVGATAAQLFLLDTGFWFTPAIVGALLAVVAVVRRDEVRALVATPRETTGSRTTG